MGTFTELLDRLREFGFKIVKAKYDVVDENVAGFEVHVLYSDGSATWFFAFTCSSDAPRFPHIWLRGYSSPLQPPTPRAFALMFGGVTAQRPRGWVSDPSLHSIPLRRGVKIPIKLEFKNLLESASFIFSKRFIRWFS